MATILIVEDRPIDRKVLATLLESSGHHVIGASDGTEALSLVSQIQPDLVISDILMPTIDGFELVRRLRESTELADTPVIFYTATYHEREAQSLARACGVVDILTKPSEPNAILAKVEAALAPGTPVASPVSEAGDSVREQTRLLNATLASKVEQLEASQQRMSAIAEFSHQIAAEHDEDTLLKQVCAAARQITLAQHAVLSTLGPDGSSTQALVGSGFDDQAMLSMRSTVVDRTQSSATIDDREPERRQNPGGRPESLGLPSDHPPVFSLLSVPIASTSRVYGRLWLHNKLGAPEFSSADEQFAVVLGTHAGIAYENARLFHDLRHRSTALEREITERKELERRLEHLIDHDFLTGLFNRRRFEQALIQETKLQGRYGGRGALLLLDLDHFKDINDRFGHKAGDDLLRAIAATLRARVRETDILARLGGDEFGIILPQADATQAQAVADAVLKALRQQKAILGDQQTAVSASVGVAMFENLNDVQVLACADLAMYEAKEAGRDGFSLYHPLKDAMTQMSSPRLTEAERIRQAVAQEQFVLYCQPIVSLKRNEVTQYELLLRLNERNELLMPNSFLYVAERFGIVQSIDAWVARKAIGMIAERARIGRPLTLNVNISGKSIGDSQLATVIEEALIESSADPSRLVLELTETAAIGNIESAKTFMNRLRHAGCRFALDDFGMGFGSFYYLKHLPFDFLKIDGDFIRGLVANRTDRLLVEAIVAIARGMGKETVAEFVADEDITEQLRQSGVDYAQGYHIGKPQLVSDVFALTDHAANASRQL
jgi:diguanylate cyclase (GGDEF)-like protein